MEEVSDKNNLTTLNTSTNNSNTNSSQQQQEAVEQQEQAVEQTTTTTTTANEQQQPVVGESKQKKQQTSKVVNKTTTTNTQKQSHQSTSSSQEQTQTGQKSNKFLKNLWNLVKDSNMLFRLGLQSRSPIDTLLEKETCTLEEILDEDDVLQEAKAHNSKLVAFLAKVENATKLIEYLTVDIKADSSSIIQTIHPSTSSSNSTTPTSPSESKFSHRDSMELSNNAQLKQLIQAELQELNQQQQQQNESENARTSSVETASPSANKNEESVRIDEEKLERRIQKYPRLAAEILCSDIDQLYATIISDKVLLSSLFGFLSNEPSLNPALASYWIRVMRCLFQRRIFDLMKFIVQQDETFAQNFVDHLNIQGMEELLLKLTGCDITLARKDISMSDVSNWWLKNGLIEKLIEKFDAKYEPEVHANVAKTLSEIVKRATTLNLDLQKTNVLAASILSEKIMSMLMDSLMKNSTSVLTEGIPLLTSLIEISFDIMSLTQNYSNDEEDDVQSLPAPLRVIMQRLDQFVALLKNPPSDLAELHLSFGTLNPPLGETRLKVVEFLSALYHIGFPPIEKELIKNNVLNTIFDLFFEYEFNNILHNIVLKNVGFILAGESMELKRSLFKDCRIVERIVEANKKNEQALNQPKGIRKGYMGHLVIISNSILTTTKSQKSIAELIQDDSGWKDFVETSLHVQNQLEAKQIGSGNYPQGGPSAMIEISQDDIDKEFEDFNDTIDDMIDDDDSSSGDSDNEDDGTLIHNTNKKESAKRDEDVSMENNKDNNDE